MIAVYIASPYTKGDVAANVRQSLMIAGNLADAGYHVFAPLLSHFWHLINPRPYESWLQMDLEWIKRCDCVLRLPGESAGADQEVGFAAMHNIPVYFTVGQLFDNMPPKTP